jgi:CxxC motif-containing protein (DUF1111 family)
VSSAIVRNPPSLAGAGLVELVASQLSSDLQRRRDEARRLAEDDDTEIRIALGARGIDYGHLTVRPDGSIDTSELVGIDDDLRVRPFGRKGRWATLREVIEDELLVHHGMLTDNLAATAVTDRVGSFGRSDPDGDSVTDEISEGQLTALTFFVAMQDVPQLVPPADGEVLSQWARGQADFVDLGCAECHVPRVRLDDAEYRVPSRRANVTRRTFLDTQGAEPRIEPAVDDDQLWVWLYSDLRRHDMGPGLAELRAEGSIPGSVFVTPALWGVAVTPPYLHDGRAPTLAEAIALHGGEAAASAAAWAERDDEGRAPLLVFLTSLRRAPRLVAR